MVIAIKLLAVLIPLAIIVVLGFKYYTDELGQVKIKARPPGLLIGIIVFVVGVFVSLAIGQVEAGSRGVVLKFGAVTGRVLNEGFYFITPVLETVQIMDVQIQKFESPARAASKDLQDVTTEVTVNYKLNPTEVDTVYQTLRTDYVSRVLVPAIEESVKAVAANFDAEELITKRPMVRTDIENTLKEKIGPFGIMVEAVSITDFQFSQVFAQSIEAKVVAVQSALEAENKLMQIQIEAQQAEAKAKGEADAAIKQAIGNKQAAITIAEGEAEAIRLVAEAQAEANDLIRTTLNDDLIKYTLTQEIGDDLRVVVVPSGADFILGSEIVGGAPQ